MTCPLFLNERGIGVKFVETMRKGDSDQIFAKVFPIVAALFALVAAVWVVIAFVDFGFAVTLLFFGVGIVFVGFVVLLSAGWVAELIADMLVSGR